MGAGAGGHAGAGKARALRNPVRRAFTLPAMLCHPFGAMGPGPGAGGARPPEANNLASGEAGSSCGQFMEEQVREMRQRRAGGRWLERAHDDDDEQPARSLASASPASCVEPGEQRQPQDPGSGPRPLGNNLSSLSCLVTPIRRAANPHGQQQWATSGAAARQNGRQSCSGK